MRAAARGCGVVSRNASLLMHRGAASLSCGSALHAEHPTCQQQGVSCYCVQMRRRLRRNIRLSVLQAAGARGREPAAVDV